MTIPLPPLAEQKRIVAKIEELLPYDCVNVHIAETENGARSITLDI